MSRQPSKVLERNLSCATCHRTSFRSFNVALPTLSLSIDPKGAFLSPDLLRETGSRDGPDGARVMRFGARDLAACIFVARSEINRAANGRQCFDWRRLFRFIRMVLISTSSRVADVTEIDVGR
eukprot:3926161-Rhodomonas_salina.6